jgi:hypothetical protein
MKKIIVILIVTLIAGNLFGQTNYTPTGTWKYTNGNDTILMIFKSDQMTVGGVTYPVLIGFHKYVTNGNVMESTLQYQNTTYLDKKFSVLLYNYQASDARNDGDIKDITLNNERYIILTKINPNTINVRLTYIAGVRKKANQTGFTLPRNFQLKQ